MVSNPYRDFKVCITIMLSTKQNIGRMSWVRDYSLCNGKLLVYNKKWGTLNKDPEF
jgi:hypothetical protein